MALLDTLLGSIAGQSNTAGGQDPLAAALSGLLAQNGGLQGLMTKFSHGGLGEVFSSWVGMGQNQTVSASQIQNVLGSNQIEGLASKLGVNQSEASQFLADHLPKIVDKLTPTGQVEAGTDQQEGLMAMLPSLLQSLSRGN
jgi:uncharacterized protein YidB (DUF937 family)